jgi:hypothetical protein
VNKVGSVNHQDDEKREESSNSNAETTNAGDVPTSSAATSSAVAVESTVQDTAKRLLQIVPPRKLTKSQRKRVREAAARDAPHA